MTPTPTPGQICYEAYLRNWTIPGLRTWDEEPLGQQRAWEAAAQAVLDAVQPPPGAALAARVWTRQAPSARWQELPPPQDLGAREADDDA